MSNCIPIEVSILNETIRLIKIGQFLTALRQVIKALTLTVIQATAFITVLTVLMSSGDPEAIVNAFTILDDHLREAIAYTSAIAIGKIFK